MVDGDDPPMAYADDHRGRRPTGEGERPDGTAPVAAAFMLNPSGQTSDRNRPTFR